MLSSESLGRLAVALTIYQFAIGLVRARVGEPLLVIEDAAERARLEKHAAREVHALALLAAACLLVALSADVGTRPGIILALIATTPALILQDFQRMRDLAARRTARALLSDSAWGALAFVLLLLWRVETSNDSEAVVWLLWASPAILGWSLALLAPLLRSRRAQMAQDGTVPDATGPSARARALGSHFSFQYLISAGVTSVSLLSLSLLVDSDAVGAVRIGGAMFGVLTVVAVGFFSHFATAIRVIAPCDAWISTRRCAIRLAALAIVLGSFCMLLPGRAGQSLFGETWIATREVLPGLTVAYTFLMISQTGFVFLKVHAGGEVSTIVRLILLPSALLLPLGGSVLAGLQGFVMGFAASHVIGAVLVYGASRRYGHLAENGAPLV